MDVLGTSAVDITKVAPMKGIPQLLTIESDRAVGIEVEVENLQLNRYPNGDVWMQKGDGSLRNNGVEYVTMPIKASDAPLALYDLLEGALNKNCCFSPRTSIHVHVDMRNETSDEVTDVVLMYTLFETLFYKFTGRGRIKNIYCVPIFDTNLLSGRAAGTSNIFRIAEVWSKYSGLNLIPIASFGTIEFRHMHGTFDVDKLSRWVRIIVKLVDYVKKQGKDFIRNFLLKESGTIRSVRDVGEAIWGEDWPSLKLESASEIQRGRDAVMTSFVEGKHANNIALIVGTQVKHLALKTEGTISPYIQFK